MESKSNLVSAARRRFMAETARAACGAGLSGVALGFFSSRSRATPATALRPPGALAEDDFPGACIRCGMCVRECPYGTLSLARPEQDVATGTPYFEARRVPCEMCEAIPCVKACPTGALDPALTDINQARMGLAVLVDQENCLNFQGLRCDVCYRACPAIDEAITLERRHNERTNVHAMFLPVVHSEHCTGCGKCERSCILEVAAIRVLPLALARGAMGEHYRLGWEEQRKAGRPLIEEQLDLPDRMPESADGPPGAVPGVQPALRGEQL